jgi:hypothetical protein
VSRNEAIVIMGLKSYLNFGPKHPDWAYAADSIVALNAPTNQKSIDKNIKINPFLQSWDTQIFKLPNDLQALSKICSLNVGSVSKCLREVHKIKTVGDTETLTLNLKSREHKSKRNCRCPKCQAILSSTGCKNPYKCYTRAQKLIDALPAKWNPQKTQVGNKNINIGLPPSLPADVHIFNKNITVLGPLANAFRIFTEGPKLNSLSPSDQDILNEDQHYISGYTDGSCIHNRDANAEAGAGIFFAPNDPKNRSIRMPDELVQSNQTGEIIAIKKVKENFPKDAKMMLINDSKLVLDSLNKYREHWVGPELDWC